MITLRICISQNLIHLACLQHSYWFSRARIPLPSMSLLSHFIFCSNCVCACVFMWLWVHECTCFKMHVEAREQSGCHSSGATGLTLRQGPYVAGGSLSRLDWLVTELQRSMSLPPQCWSANLCHHICPVVVFRLLIVYAGEGECLACMWHSSHSSSPWSRTQVSGLCG